MIYQIDSLGNILIANNTDLLPASSPQTNSEREFGSLPRVSLGSNYDKNLFVPTYSEYQRKSPQNVVLAEKNITNKLKEYEIAKSLELQDSRLSETLLSEASYERYGTFYEKSTSTENLLS